MDPSFQNRRALAPREVSSWSGAAAPDRARELWLSIAGWIGEGSEKSEMQLVCQQQELDGPQGTQTCPSGLQDMLDLATEVLAVMATSRHMTGKKPQADLVFISTTTSCGHQEPVINTTAHLPVPVPSPG